jgi:hypothetical protein
MGKHRRPCVPLSVAMYGAALGNPNRILDTGSRFAADLTFERARETTKDVQYAFHLSLSEGYQNVGRELSLTEFEPHWLFGSRSADACTSCEAIRGLYRCSTFRSTGYCSVVCQRDYWEVHNWYCTTQRA